MRNAVVRFGLWSPVLLFALQGACSNNAGTVGGNSSAGSNGGESHGGAGGSLTITIPPGAGGSGGSSGSGTGGTAVQSTAGNCGTVTGKADRVPADVLLVQDASGSMTWSIAEDCDCQATWGGGSAQPCPNTTTCVERWTTLQSAVSAAVTANSGINWGLELFADPKNAGVQGCNVAATPQVPISGTSASAITQTLASVRPKSATPTASAIKVATSYLKTVTDSNKKAILLATDGQPNCNNGRGDAGDLSNTLAAIKAAADAGFPVYVVGIGPSTDNMDSMAQNGGTSKYYPATSPQQLSDALAQISKVVASCTFTSSTPPPDPSLVYVYVDKKLIDKDAANGWAFGANNSTIVLHGSVCDAIMAGTSKLVEIVFGCPGVTPPDIIP